MKDYPLNFKIADETAKEFQEIMHKLESDNQTETFELIVKVAYVIITAFGIGKFISYLRK